METDSKDILVLGAIRHGAKKFQNIQKHTQLEPKQLESILESLEEQDYIKVEMKKGLLGEKIEITPTERGIGQVDLKIEEMQTKWRQMSTLYKQGDKSKLKQVLDENKSMLPTMMFFGVMDMVMFGMMFGMIGAMATDYIPAESMTGDAGDQITDANGADGGFDFDIGF